MAKITGACKWACVNKPNTKFTPQWSIDVMVSEAQAAKLEAAGLNVKADKETGEKFIKIKRNVTTKAGKTADAPTVLDASGREFTGAVGNGSVVEVDFGIFDSGFGGKGTYLNTVVVKNLVPYGDDVSFDDDDDDEVFNPE